MIVTYFHPNNGSSSRLRRRRVKICLPYPKILQHGIPQTHYRKRRKKWRTRTYYNIVRSIQNTYAFFLEKKNEKSYLKNMVFMILIHPIKKEVHVYSKEAKKSSRSSSLLSITTLSSFPTITITPSLLHVGVRSFPRATILVLV